MSRHRRRDQLHGAVLQRAYGPLLRGRPRAVRQVLQHAADAPTGGLLRRERRHGRSRRKAVGRAQGDRSADRHSEVGVSLQLADVGRGARNGRRAGVCRGHGRLRDGVRCRHRHAVVEIGGGRPHHVLADDLRG